MMNAEHSKYRNPPLPLRAFPKNRRIESIEEARSNIFNHGERVFAVAVLTYLERMNLAYELYHEPHQVFRPDVTPDRKEGQRIKTIPDFLLVSWNEDGSYKHLYVEVTITPQFPSQTTRAMLTDQYQFAPEDKLAQKLVMEEADEPYAQVYSERLQRYAERMNALGIEYTYTGDVPRVFEASLRKFLTLAVEQQNPDLIPHHLRRWLTRGELNGEINLLPSDIHELIEEIWAITHMQTGGEAI